MIINYIQQILRSERAKDSNQLYFRMAIKEYLQIILLQFIYTNSDYKNNLIFTGGTCLRHLYGLERLSEDLDFDMRFQLDTERLAKEIQKKFFSSLKYEDLDISVKQKGRQILLKFPILKQLGLADENESNLLYVKIDISEIIGKSYQIEKTAKSAFGYNFVALHYSLSSLFSGKVVAILKRNLFKGKENTHTLKGRDFYDLLWFLKKGVNLNLQLVKEKLNQPDLDIFKLNDEVKEKVALACTKYKNDFKNDLMPFVNNIGFITDYVENYAKEFSRYKLVEAEKNVIY